MTHELKILPLYFEAVALREKTFEIRINDRDYHVGDTLLLKEWENGNYTGRAISRYVNYIFYGDGTFGIPDGVVIMNLKLSATKAVADTSQTDEQFCIEHRCTYYYPQFGGCTKNAGDCPHIKDEPQTDIPKSTLLIDCTGCRFVGTYDTEFPCANCVRKNKDYYDSEQTERSKR